MLEIVYVLVITTKFKNTSMYKTHIKTNPVKLRQKLNKNLTKSQKDNFGL